MPHRHVGIAEAIYNDDYEGVDKEQVKTRCLFQLSEINDGSMGNFTGSPGWW